MRPFNRSFIALALVAALASTACTTIAPGHVGIVVNKFGGNRGVQDLPLVTGMVSYNPFTTTVYEYPTYVQTAVWTKDPNEGSATNEEITFNSKEGLGISADVSLSYQLDGTKAAQFYVQFRSDDITHFTHGYLHNVARDAFNESAAQYTAEELYSTKKEEFLKQVRDRVNAQVSPLGIHLEQLGFIGVMRLPQNVVDALNGKIQAVQDAQRAQNQVQQAQAQALIAVAKANGEAQANARLAASLSSNLLEWRRLEIQQQAIAKWNGALPQFSGNATPFISLPAPSGR